MRKSLFVLLFTLAAAFQLQAQKDTTAKVGVSPAPPVGAPIADSTHRIITLKQCVDLALSNNLSIKLSEASRDNAALSYWQSKYNYVPTLNASVGFTRTTGTTFDNVNFKRAQSNLNTSNPSLVASVPVFAGLYNRYTVLQTKNNLQAYQYALEYQKNTILTSVINAYLQIIFDQSNIDIEQYKIDILKKQLDRVTRMYNAGAGVEYDVLNVQSQIAVEQQNLITNQNTYDNDKLILIQYLQLNPGGSASVDYQFEKIDTSLLKIAPRVDKLPNVVEVERYALENMPEMKQNQYAVAASHYARLQVFSGYFPTLTLSGGIQSSYSSNDGTTNLGNLAYKPISFLDSTTGLPKIVNGTNGRYYQTNYPNSTFTKSSYFSDLSDNKSEYIGLRLNIPILGNWIVRRNVEQAKITERTAQLNYEVAQNTLVKNVRTSYLNLVAAKEKIANLETQKAAIDKAFAYADAQYTAGSTNFFTYLQSLNNQAQLQQQQIQSLYDYFFKKKILDFYQGKPLGF